MNATYPNNIPSVGIKMTYDQARANDWEQIARKLGKLLRDRSILATDREVTEALSELDAAK